MLEQFRVLRAALQLREFTAAQLADASGVAEGTVQKMIRRRQDLFEVIDPAGPSRGRRPARLHQVRPEAARVALQAIVDNPEDLPLPVGLDGMPLGLQLARNTLLQAFPGCAPGERLTVLRAAAVQLDFPCPPHLLVEQAELARLRRALLTLVRITDTLSANRGVYPSKQQEWSDLVLAAGEDLMSAARRAEREAAPETRAAAALRLAKLPLLSARLAAAVFWPDKSHAWAVELPEAAFHLQASGHWMSVVGDLCKDELRAQAAAQASEEEGAGLVSHLLAGSARKLATLTSVFVIGDKNPPTRYPPPTQVVPGEDWRHVLRSVSATPEGRIRIRLNSKTFVSPDARYRGDRFATIDLNLTAQSYVGAIIQPEDRFQQPFWVEGTLTEDRPATARAAYVLGNDRHLPEDPEEVRTGAALWDDLVFQVRFDPGQQIPVLQAEEETLLQQLNTVEEHRIGDLHWIDIFWSEGRLLRGHVLQDATRKLVAMPFSDLEYDSHRRCFLHRGGGGRQPSLRITGQQALPWFRPTRENSPPH